MEDAQLTTLQELQTALKEVTATLTRVCKGGEVPLQKDAENTRSLVNERFVQPLDDILGKLTELQFKKNSDGLKKVIKTHTDKQLRERQDEIHQKRARQKELKRELDAEKRRHAANTARREQQDAMIMQRAAALTARVDGQVVAKHTALLAQKESSVQAKEARVARAETAKWRHQVVGGQALATNTADIEEAVREAEALLSPAIDEPVTMSEDDLVPSTRVRLG